MPRHKIELLPCGCFWPGCGKSARPHGRFCEAHHSQQRRGSISEGVSDLRVPPHRPRKKWSELSSRQQRAIRQDLNGDVASEMLSRSTTPANTSEAVEYLSRDNLLTSTTNPLDHTVVRNLGDAFQGGQSHFTAPKCSKLQQKASSQATLMTCFQLYPHELFVERSI